MFHYLHSKLIAMKGWLLALGMILLITLEISNVYFIMPFPGSQRANTIDLAYFIHNNIWWLRLLLIVILLIPVFSFFRRGRWWQRTLLSIGVLLYAFVAYEVNFKMLADKMFLQPKEKLFLSMTADTTQKNKLVLGVVINNQAKAYPVEILGYHHQVQDSVGGVPVIVTYCTVCRTGRVYSPLVQNKLEKFRLVGMDHFNAMFEDATTKSWWRQENGEAIAGPMKGKKLQEIPSRQMTLQDWVALYPNSMILQPDKNFTKNYKELDEYDEGTIKGGLEHTDTLSWKQKSWVIGVAVNNNYKAYDWNQLAKQYTIEDAINNTPILLTVSQDKKTAYVFLRTINNQIFTFSYLSDNTLTDMQTHSQWSISGQCTAGILKGVQLETVQSYQEFWHSWQTFHPGTAVYR